jgi:hypothetical protein
MRNYGAAALEPDGELGHRVRLSQSVTIGDVVYSSDERGTRPAGVSDPGLPQVLVLGDSVSFGWGVREESAWPAVLEQQLAARGTHVDVTNAAVVAYGAHQYRR